MSITSENNKPLKSILYVRLPCPKIWPAGIVYLADHIHKQCPQVEQRILDLSLTTPDKETELLRKTIDEFKPEAIAFSWRVVQPFSPDEDDPSLTNAFQFYFSRNPVTKFKAALFGAKSILSYDNRVKKTLRLIKETCESSAQSQIILGGPAFSVFWDFILPKLPQKVIGVIGEAENALLKIVKGLPLTGDRFVFQQNGALKCGNQDQFVDLAAQTPVDFAYIHSIFEGFDQYLNEPIGIQTKRGCPFGCIYCLYNYIEGKKVRYRNPEVIAKELETLKNNYGVRRFWFCDSQFFPAPKDYNICEQTLDEIISRKLDIQWSAYMRIERITEPIARKMISSGVSDLEVSMNSGSQAVINTLKLGYRVEQLFEACKILKKVGFKDKAMRLNLSLNAPGETKESLLETVQAVKNIKNILGEQNVIPFIFFLAIQPKTELAKYAIKHKLIPPTWDPLALNPFIIKKLIYNPPPLKKLIGKSVIATLDAGDDLGPGVLNRLENSLR